MRGSLSLVLAVSLTVHGSASAQTSVDADLLKGIHELQAGDLDAAVLTLDAAVLRLSAMKTRQPDLARAYAYLGMAHLGLGRTEDAKAKLRLAYAADPSMQLDPKQFPPTIIQFYEQARRDSTTAPAPAPGKATPVAPTPARTQPTVTTTEKKGGGGKIALIVLGGAAVAGVGIAAAGGGGGSSSDGPSATQSTLTAAGNYRGISGSWRGSISAGTNQPGGTVSFTVVDDSRVDFTIGLSPVYCEHPVEGAFGPSPGSIANNAFDLPFFGNKAVRGRFLSPTTAEGTVVDLRTNGQPGNCNRSWTASKQ